RRQVLLVATQQRSAHRDLRRVVVLDVDEAQITHDLRLDLLLGEYLNDIHVELSSHEIAEGVLVAALVEEVAEEDDDTRTLALEAERPQRLAQIARPRGVDPVEESQHSPQAFAATHGWHGMREVVGERLDDDAIVVDQTDKPKCRRDLPGVVELRRLA